MAKKRKKYNPRKYHDNKLSPLFMKSYIYNKESELLDRIIQQLETGFLEFQGDRAIISYHASSKDWYEVVPMLQSWQLYWTHGIERFNELGYSVSLDFKAAEKVIKCLEYKVLLQRSHIEDLKFLFNETKKIISSLPYEVIKNHCYEEFEYDDFKKELKSHFEEVYS